MLIQLTVEDRAIQIKKYGEEAISAFSIGWTSFYRDPPPQSRCIVFDTFHATGILTSRAAQFEKMTTQSNKGTSVDYSSDDWYVDIYYYYTNQKSPLPIDRIEYALIKRQAKYY